MTPRGWRAAAQELASRLDSGPALSSAHAGEAMGARLQHLGFAVHASPAASPSPAFRAALRTRLMAVAAVQGVYAPTPAQTRARSVSQSAARRASGVAAGALASVVAVTGVAVAGSQSLPGDPFYGVKRGTEALQTRFAGDDVGTGTRHLDLAAIRLREVRGLTLGRDAVADVALRATGVRLAGYSVAAGTASTVDRPVGVALGGAVSERVRQTLADMDDETRTGTALLNQAYRRTQAPEPLRALSRFATRQSAGLELLMPSMDGASLDRARDSLALVTGVAVSTDQLLRLGTCGATCDPGTVAPLPPPVTTPTAEPGIPVPTPAASPTACGCAPVTTPTPPAPGPPAPAAEPSEQPAAATPAPSDAASPSPSPAAQRPSPAASPAVPLPSLPGAVPSLPVPLPSFSAPSLPLPLPSLPGLLPSPLPLLVGPTGPASS